MELLDTKERPSYVRFERAAVEDKAASLREGHYVACDLDYALVTAPGSKDIFKNKATNWLADLKIQAELGRIPREWVEHYSRQYQAWKNGQELPMSGTPIRGWGVVSPAQQEMIIHNNVLTVEDLATLNEEGLRRLGMGAMQMKTKAAAWIAQLQDKGPLVQEIAAVRSENVVLRTSLDALTRQMESLQYAIQHPSAAPMLTPSVGVDIEAALAAPVPNVPGKKRRHLSAVTE